MTHYSYAVSDGVVRSIEGKNIAFAVSSKLAGVEQYLMPVGEIDLVRRRIYDTYSVVEVLRNNKQTLHFAFLTNEAAMEFHVAMIQACEKALRAS